MSNPPLTEKLVYLALKDIFVGNEIQPNITKKISKKVRKRIEKFQDDIQIKALIEEHTLQRITEVAVVLLDKQIFGSHSKAKARFPDFFEVPPSQNDQPIDSGPNIAECNPATVQRIGLYSPEELLSIGASLKTRNEEEQVKANLLAYVPKITTSEVAGLKITKGDGPETSLQNTLAVSESLQQLHTQPRTVTQSLDSIRLPLWDQHRILVRVQYALEKACFTFAQKHLRGVLQREGWDCAEAVELNRWPKFLLLHQEECGLNNINYVDRPLPILLNSITQLRHDTVHRAHLSSSKILQHLTDAVLLARLLHDDICAESISTIRYLARDAIEQMMRSKQLLDDKLAKIKKDFAMRRAELKRREFTLLEAAMREHKEPMISVSGSLDRLSGDLGGSDKVHGGWGHAYDGILSRTESSEPRNTVQSKKEQETGVESVEPNEESGKGVDQLSVSPVLVTTKDGFIEVVPTCEKKNAGKSKDEGLSKPQARPAQKNLELNSHEIDPKQYLKHSLPQHQNVSMTTNNVAEEGEEKIEAAAVVTSGWDDSDQQGYDEEALSEPSTDPAPTGEEKTENDADLDRDKSPIQQVIPAKYTEEEVVAGVESRTY